MADASSSQLADDKKRGTAALERPEYAFDPKDPWTQTFQEGLKKAALEGKAVYEVGVGTGTNAAFVLRHCGAALFFGSDLDPRLVELAERNVQSLAPQQADRFQPVRGAVSLIDNDEAREKLSRTDVVIACLPQVGDPNDEHFTSFREEHSIAPPIDEGGPAEDHIAHYYPWKAFDEYPFNAVGLGLNEALLRRIREFAPKAEVVMNFGARIGSDIIFQMFRANGFAPEKLASRLVLQHAGTDISFFVALEGALKGTGLEQDFVCKFFADEAGQARLSAHEAQAMLDEDPEVPLYHEVCVIRGRPMPDA